MPKKLEKINIEKHAINGNVNQLAVDTVRTVNYLIEIIHEMQKEIIQLKFKNQTIK